MIYGRIVTIGVNEVGQNKYNFELYNASSEMMDDYIKFQREEKDKINQSLFVNEDEKETSDSYLISKNIPLIFLAKNNFMSVSEDFFFLKQLILSKIILAHMLWRCLCNL